MAVENYLKDELYRLVQTDPDIFEFLQAGSLDGVWYWDMEEGGNEWMSPRFWEVFGYDPATRKHHASEWQGMIHPEDLKVALANLEQHCADPSHPYDQVVRYEHADGSTVWVRCRGLAVRDANGVPVRLLGAHNDITALKQAEAALTAKVAELEEAHQALEASNTKLARSNERLSSFAHVASHDLQEPLRMVSQFGAMLSEREEVQADEQARTWLGHIADSSNRMRDLVQGLLDWSSVGEGGTACVEVRLDSLLAVVQQDLAAAISEAGAQFDVGVLPPVRGDAEQLRRLLQNLIGNAIKYRAVGVAPRIRVAAGEVEGGWQISVADNGIGIAPRHHERIFAPFKRLHARSRYSGSGIGLAICQRIVQEHRGTISVRSEGEGAGSVFEVFLPRPPG